MASSGRPSRREQVHIIGRELQSGPIFSDRLFIIALVKIEITADIITQGIKGHHSTSGVKTGMEYGLATGPYALKPGHTDSGPVAVSYGGEEA